MPVNQTIQTLLAGHAGRHTLPFLWLHGEEEPVLREMMAAIDGAGCKAVCVESRPHPDFCGPQWWADMDVILDEARARGMRVWILDDSHFPTGFANGAVRTAPETLCRQSIFCRCQPLPDAPGRVTADLRAAGLMDAPRRTYANAAEAAYFGKPPARVFDPAADRLLAVQAVTDGGTVTDLLPLVRGTVFDWTKPAGAYTLQVVTASRNAGCHRDYINMTDPASVRLLIDAVYEPHWAHYAADFGKTIAGFFSDEPELGNGFLYQKGNTLGCGQDLPWSAPLEAALAEACGPGWAAALPRLFRQDGRDATARIHTVYMDCLTKLVRVSFSEQLAAWCHGHGVQYIGHAIEDDGQHCRTGSGLGHYFRALQGQDMAGIDDIGGQVLPQGEDAPQADALGRPRSGTFYHYGLATLAESAAAIEPAKGGNAMCEIFGNYGWAEGVRLEKYLADHFLVRGINWFVPHAFSGKAFPDPDCPPHFYAHGHNPQYRHFGRLMAYMDRVATLTSSGTHAMQAAVLYHGEAEWCDPDVMPFEQVVRPLYDDQIACRVLPADVFSEPGRYQTEPGDPLVVNGQPYRAFVVPGASRMPAAAAKALAELAEKGLPVFFAGQRPEALFEGGALPAPLAACPVVDPAGLSAALRAAGVAAPVLEPQNDRLRLLTIEGEAPCVLLVNEGTAPCTGTLTLPGFSGPCCWYDPWANRCEPAEAADTPGGLRVAVHILPLHPRVLVTGELPGSGALYAAPAAGAAIPLTGWTRAVCEGTEYPHFGPDVPVTLPDALAEEQPEFSGFVRYETRFTLESAAPLRLTISDAAEGVEVFLNGQSAGIQIVPPFAYDLAGQAGENTLAIEVATTLERQCYPLLQGYARMLAAPPACGSGITGAVTLRRVP